MRNYPQKFDTYFEPFLGGGAVMFNLLTKHPGMKCHVSDLNSDLILTYIAIRDKVGEVIESLETIQKIIIKIQVIIITKSEYQSLAILKKFQD